MKRLPMLGLAAALLTFAGCGDDTGNDTGAPLDTAPPTSSLAESDPPTTPPADWAAQLVAAFEAYDAERTRLDDQVGEQLRGIEELTEQDTFDAFADMLDGSADAGDALVTALPAGVPDDIGPLFDAVLRAHDEQLTAMRAAAAVLRTGDSELFNDLSAGAVAAFRTACADLQFALVDLDAGFLPCGIDADDPTVRDFVEMSTVEVDNEFVAMPAGSHELDYLGQTGLPPVGTVVLDYDQSLLIRTSIELAEIATAPEGARLRIHASGLVANPTKLGSDAIQDYWPIGLDPTAWIGALDGVVVTATSSGSVGGLDARSWDLGSERTDTIAILGDGDGWIPETTLAPGESLRLWTVDVGGSPLLVTLHPPVGGDLTSAADDLDLLLAGLALRPA